MLMEGVDYSWARPDPAALTAAGKRFAVRYIGTPTSGKNLTAAEAARLRAAGVDLVAVYQTTAAFMTTSDGAAAARVAHPNAVACGMPAGRPIYFALDTNPAVLSNAQWVGVERFLDQAASVLGRARVGVYAGFAGIERLCPGRARWGWQTYAWSGGRWSPKAQLQQYRNGVTLAGGTVDLCRSTAPDFGQWGATAPADPAPSPEEIDMPDIKIYDCTTRPALLFGAGPVRRLDKTQRDAVRSRGIAAERVDAAVSDAIWSLAEAVPVVDVNEAAIAAAVAGLVTPAVIAALPDELTDHLTVDNVETTVRTVLEDVYAAAAAAAAG